MQASSSGGEATNSQEDGSGSDFMPGGQSLPSIHNTKKTAFMKSTSRKSQ